MDPMGGEEDGTVMMVHIHTGSGVNWEQVVQCFGVLSLVMSW